MSYKCFDFFGESCCESHFVWTREKLLWILNVGLISFQTLFWLQCNKPCAPVLKKNLLKFIQIIKSKKLRLNKTKVIKKLTAHSCFHYKKEWKISNIKSVCLCDFFQLCFALIPTVSKTNKKEIFKWKETKVKINWIKWNCYS